MGSSGSACEAIFVAGEGVCKGTMGDGDGEGGGVVCGVEVSGIIGDG